MRRGRSRKRRRASPPAAPPYERGVRIGCGDAGDDGRCVWSRRRGGRQGRGRKRVARATRPVRRALFNAGELRVAHGGGAGPPIPRRLGGGGGGFLGKPRGGGGCPP